MSPCRYDDEGERIDPDVPDPASLDPLEVLQEFCDIMAAEIDQEVGEYAAYIGVRDNQSSRNF